MYKISFFLNGKFRTALISPTINTLNFLRNNCELTGTKEGCSEGDCGACTIVIGGVKNNRVNYQTVNSCLMPALKIHGKHIITIEGIGTPDKLHPIQKALLDFHGVQCGYCTPGIIMSLFGLFLNNPSPSKVEIFNSLEGNLCRCTGYESIRKATEFLSQQNHKNRQKFIPDYLRKTDKLLLAFNRKIIKFPDSDNNHQYIIPNNLNLLYQSLSKNKEYKIINGGTDLMVDFNTKNINYNTIIDISQIKELNFIRKNKDSIVIGANISLSEILNAKIILQKIPLLNQAITMLGSQQIRNIATITGNIANASPIADVATALLALDVQLTIKSSKQQRKIKLADFYRGYKKTALKPSEIIYAVEVPTKPVISNFLKTAKRKSVDIASVNSAISLEQKNKVIQNVIIAFGGVAQYPIIVRKTCQYLKGKKISAVIIEKASQIAESELKPISDLRGTENFRRILIRNHIIKHLNTIFEQVN